MIKRILLLIIPSFFPAVTQSTLEDDKRNSFSSKDKLIFSTCNSKRNFGPKQQMCEAAYKDTTLDSIRIHPSMPGVQVWTVPRTGEYSILALGAQGGRAIEPLHQSHETEHLASYVVANLELSEGTQLYILVGQKGQDACSSGDCEKLQAEEIPHNWGGGGGGGGTFIFTVDDDTNETIPLIIAGGGGGVGVGPFQKERSVLYSDIDFTISGTNGNMSVSGAGAGGGWSGVTDSIQAGMSLLNGSFGGTGCPGPNGRHHTVGGFGGGGGACRGGGGGGGYKGGDGGSLIGNNGQDGSSFINKSFTGHMFEPNIQSGDGEVEIYEYFPCACDEFCTVEDSVNRTYTCTCHAGKSLMPDKHTCSLTVLLTPEKEHDSNKKLILIFGSLASVIIIIVSCYVYHLLKRRMNPVMLETCAGSKATPSNINRIAMQINASYTALNSSNPYMEIKQIPREQIKCIRHIGRGAFGEVFQGVILPTNREHLPPKVAIKTLPAIYTEELEVDFVMEAVIMSKFEHPNIVKFLGVCFDNVRPHYIVLELLEGGNLKQFLFESRPKLNEPSCLNVLQMVKIASDIAKGCQYLEKQHFIHRDIAARNCLLTIKGPGGVAKIADFGMTRDVYRSNYYRKTSRGLLPVKWMPPEAYLDGIFTSKADVWAYGITLWEIFSMASDPYPGKSNQEVMQFVWEGGRLPSPENCPLSIFHIMTCTWDPNPDERPSFSTIVQKLQYCYEDPNTATYTLPTFLYHRSKETFVELPDLENSLTKKDDKKSSHPSLFSESLSEMSEHNSSNRQIKNDNDELRSCSGDIYKNSTKQAYQDINTKNCNHKGDRHVPGIRSYINYLYMNQELPAPNNENIFQFDSRENKTENQTDTNTDDNLLHNEHYHNHHPHQHTNPQTSPVPSPTLTPTSHHLQQQLQGSPRQSKQQKQQQSRSRSNSSSSSSNNINNHNNNNSHHQHQQLPQVLQLMQRNNLFKEQQQQKQLQQQQPQLQEEQHKQHQQQQLQLQQHQDLNQQDDLNKQQQQQQLEQAQEPEEYEQYNVTSFSPSPTKIPLLSSTDSDVSSYENDSFSKNSLRKSLRESSHSSNYIPMKKIQDNTSRSKYINLNANSLYLDTQVVDKSDSSSSN